MYFRIELNLKSIQKLYFREEEQNCLIDKQLVELDVLYQIRRLNLKVKNVVKIFYDCWDKISNIFQEKHMQSRKNV